MFDYPELPASLCDRVLNYLGCPPLKAETRAVNGLISAYVRKVPWESAFRIVKRGRTPGIEERPRWPEEFWSDAIERGGGGTCFESNYAFLALLRSFGYAGYLTINNMGEAVGCHTAIVLLLNGQKRLVDVGIPLHKSLLIRSDQTTRTPTYFHTYLVRPIGGDQYAIERTNHPKRNIYTLVDQPVADHVYRAAMCRDYGEQGLFLDRVIINKVIDGKIWRFNSSELPLQLEAFDRRNKTEILLPAPLLARRLAMHFRMERAVIQMALDVVNARHMG